MTALYRLVIILMMICGFVFIAAITIAVIESMYAEDCDYTEEDDDDDSDR